MPCMVMIWNKTLLSFASCSNTAWTQTRHRVLISSLLIARCRLVASLFSSTFGNSQQFLVNKNSFLTDPACAREFLSRGTDPNATGPRGDTSLVSAPFPSGFCETKAIRESFSQISRLGRSHILISLSVLCIDELQCGDGQATTRVRG